MATETQTQVNTPEREALAELLRNSPFLQEHLSATPEKEQELSPLEKVAQGLAARATFELYKPDKNILLQGQPPTGFFFIMTGQVQITRTENEATEILNFMGEGQFLGELGMLTQAPRYANATTLLETYVARFEVQDWDWLLETAPTVKKAFEDMKAEYDEHQKIKDFPGRQSDEVIFKNLNRHIMVYIADLAGPLLLILTGLVLGALLKDQQLSFGPTLATVVTSLFIGVGILWVIYAYFEWENDDFIISSKRIIHIERYIFSGTHREEAPLTRVLDIEVNTPNFFTRSFRYSNVIIKTAGRGTIVFDGIQSGDRVKQLIFHEVAKAKARVRASDISAIRESLRKMHQPPPLPVPDAKEEPVSKFRLPSFEDVWQTLKRLLDYYIPRTKTEVDGGIVWRKHYWIWFKKVWLPGTVWLLVTSSLIMTLVKDIGGGHSSSIVGALTVLWLIVSVWYTYQHDDWRKDTYQVTGTKIIHQDSTAFRLRGEEIKETTFDNVQNISFNIPGFFAQMFQIGDVVIKTASVGEPFIFDNVMHPRDMQQDIFRYWEDFKTKQRAAEQEHEEERFTTWLREYDTISREK